MWSIREAVPCRDPEQMIEESSFDGLVAAALQSLSESSRTLVWLVDIQGLSIGRLRCWLV